MFRAIVIGNLGSDARVENNNGRPFVSFSVGHNDRYTDSQGNVKETTQWISCAMNGDGGKLLEFLKKGKSVYVEGRCSTRVFSSEKERRMVAGVNLSVDHLELLGGSSDEVPRNLADSQGLLHRTNKAYYIAAEEAKAICGKEKTANLFSVDNRVFLLQKAGWVTPVVQETSVQENKQENGEPEVF